MRIAAPSAAQQALDAIHFADRMAARQRDIATLMAATPPLPPTWTADLMEQALAILSVSTARCSVRWSSR